ncbi:MULTISPECIES: hypothetical protein [Sinorhizobium]|nr:MULTISPECIES: hypothetical protein [unclassified Sinorhizobium]WEJ12608.1 hypothetical protein N0Q90_28790 [Sinorhizobium sp. M103]WEJ19049.1 hypothetical protein N0Q91_26770 [Sinorhizobium sp. K101]WEJ39017.1 hypothetical protein N0R80_25335 [Sinorhizobium sp. C101]
MQFLARVRAVREDETASLWSAVCIGAGQKARGAMVGGSIKPEKPKSSI